MEPVSIKPLPDPMPHANPYPCSKSQHYSKSEWQSKKPIIKRLYLDLGEPLRRVMKIMTEEHNFHPTRKMYVGHLATWGFGKNCTKKNVSGLLHWKREGAASISASKLGGEGRVVGTERLKKYLKRTHQDIRIPAVQKDGLVKETNEEEIRQASTSIDEVCEDVPSDLRCSQSSSSVKLPEHSDYEVLCPYRPWAKKFRLIESFPNGTTYEADSVGLRSYIAADEERQCTENCYCRRHIVSNDFSFQVHKDFDRMDITIFSDDLYHNLLGYELEGLQEEVKNSEKTMNGLILLKNFHSLKSKTDALRSKTHCEPLTQSLLLEMELLVDGLLADGEVFKSFGYEELYERQFLNSKLWIRFQQDAFERDMSVLEEGFDEIDREYDDLPTPPQQPDSGKAHDLEEELEEVPTSLCREVSSNEHFIPAESASDIINDGKCGLSFVPTADLVSWGSPTPGTEACKALGECLVGYDLFSKAVATGNQTVIQLLLDQGADVNGGDSYSPGCPLAMAVEAGREAVVRLLLDRGADVNGYNRWQGCPLAMAAEAGHEAVARLLLDQGADVNGYNGWRGCPLAVAAEAEHEAVVRLLLDRGADLTVLCGYYIEECSLFTNGEAGYEKVVRLLLDRETDVIEHEQLVNDAMVASATCGQMITMRRFINFGADINAITRYGTALSAAARTGDGRTVRWLLRQGAEVHTTAHILQKSNDKKAKMALIRLASWVRNFRLLSTEGQSYSHSKRAEKFRYLHRKFIDQHVLMKTASQGSLTDFVNLSRIFQFHRDTWQAGVKTLRGLHNGEQPTMATTIAYLCLVKAISEILQSTSMHDYTEPFFQDLGRWVLIFTEERDRDAYRDAIHTMWGVLLDERMSSTGQVDPDVTKHFFSLASILISQTSEEFGWDSLKNQGLQQNQRAWKLRNGHVPSVINAAPSEPHLRDPQIPECLPTEPPDQEISSTPDSSEQNTGDDSPPVVAPYTVAVFLMLGASFAITIIFLQWLRNTFLNYMWTTTLFPNIDTLQERYCNLENYMGLKGSHLMHQMHSAYTTEELFSSNNGFGFDSYGNF